MNISFHFPWDKGPRVHLLGHMLRARLVLAGTALGYCLQVLCSHIIRTLLHTCSPMSPSSTAYSCCNSTPPKKIKKQTTLIYNIILLFLPSQTVVSFLFSLHGNKALVRKNHWLLSAAHADTPHTGDGNQCSPCPQIITPTSSHQHLCSF